MGAIRVQKLDAQTAKVSGEHCKDPGANYRPTMHFPMFKHIWRPQMRSKHEKFSFDKNLLPFVTLVTFNLL